MKEHQPTTQELNEALIGIVMESPGIAVFLNQIAALASRELPHEGEPAHCAVTLIRDSEPRAIANSSEIAKLADEMQYARGDGPCLTAALNGEEIQVRDFAAEERWPDYGRDVSAQGIRSLLAVPIPLPGDSKCGINIYSTEPRQFSGGEIEAVREFARQASSAVQLAIRIGEMQTRTEDLIAAMRSRTVIDIAIGIVMGQSRCSQAEAFAVLRSASSHRNQKLRDVAAEVVQSVSGQPIETHFTG